MDVLRLKKSYYLVLRVTQNLPGVALPHAKTFDLRAVVTDLKRLRPAQHLPTKGRLCLSRVKNFSYVQISFVSLFYRYCKKNYSSSIDIKLEQTKRQSSTTALQYAPFSARTSSSGQFGLPVIQFTQENTFQRFIECHSFG